MRTITKVSCRCRISCHCGTFSARLDFILRTGDTARRLSMIDDRGGVLSARISLRYFSPSFFSSLFLCSLSLSLALTVEIFHERAAHPPRTESPEPPSSVAHAQHNRAGEHHFSRVCTRLVVTSPPPLLEIPTEFFDPSNRAVSTVSFFNFKTNGRSLIGCCISQKSLLVMNER